MKTDVYGECDIFDIVNPQSSDLVIPPQIISGLISKASHSALLYCRMQRFADRKDRLESDSGLGCVDEEYLNKYSFLSANIEPFVSFDVGDEFELNKREEFLLPLVGYSDDPCANDDSAIMVIARTIVVAFGLLIFLLVFWGLLMLLIKRRHVKAQYHTLLTLEVAQRQTSERIFDYISHEIRNILNGIYGMSVFIRDSVTDLVSFTETTENAPAELIHDQIIDEITLATSDTSRLLFSCDMLNIVVNDVLKLRQISEGRVQADMQIVTMSSLLSTLMNIMRVRLQARPQVVVRATLAMSLMQSYFKVDYTHTLQVLVNFLSNAMKFTEQGSIHVSASIDQNRLRKGWLKFKCQDTGPGISPKMVPLIFKQTFVKSSHRMKGAGFGLFVCSQLVEKVIHGTIGFSTKVGCGSTFWFSAPFQKVSAVGKQVLLPDQRTYYSGTNNPNNAFIDVTSSTRVMPPPKRTWSQTFTVDESKHMSSDDEEDSDDDDDDLQTDSSLPTVAMPSISADISGDEDPRARALSLPFDRVILPDNKNEWDRGGGIINDDRGLSYGVLANTKQRPLKSGILKDTRVLVVDDSPMNRAILTRCLESQGALVTQASNGMKAVREVNRTEFEVIWMNINMPITDGIRATRFLRKFVAFKKVIIGLTGDVSPECVQKCLDAGMNSVEHKPIQPKRVVQITYRYASIVKS